MVAIFTGAGSGLERGSAAVLGEAGLLGSGTVGRSGQRAMVNAATGNLLIDRRDEFLIGRGPDAAATRTYNSRAETSDDNGDQWRLGSDRRLFGLVGTANAVGSSIKRVSGDGSVSTYSWNGGAYVSTDGAGAYDQITFDGAAWAWTDGDSQMVETYGSTYNGEQYLTLITDRSGDSVSYAYGFGDNRLTRMTTANGEALDYTWTGQNVISISATFSDPQTGALVTRSRTAYAYDSSNRLIRATIDLTPQDNTIDAYETNYTYVGSSHLIYSMLEADGSGIYITYDELNRVQSIYYRVASGSSRTTVLGYAAGATTVTDALGRTTRLEYDASDRLTNIIRPSATLGAAAQATQFAYSSDGSVSAITDSYGRQASFTHDANGNVATTVDQLGNMVSRTYGSRNELLTETWTGSDVSGDATRQTVRYSYDAFGRTRFATSAEGAVTETVYNAFGQVTKTLSYRTVLDVDGVAEGATLDTATLQAWVSDLADRSARVQR
jgi:YD repeat-containing protein